MSKEDEDLALQTLLANRLQVAPDLDDELLKRCYAIQKKYQFSDDRSLPATAIEKLVDAKVSGMTD